MEQDLITRLEEYLEKMKDSLKLDEREAALENANHASVVLKRLVFALEDEHRTGTIHRDIRYLKDILRAKGPRQPEPELDLTKF